VARQHTWPQLQQAVAAVGTVQQQMQVHMQQQDVQAALQASEFWQELLSHMLLLQQSLRRQDSKHSSGIARALTQLITKVTPRVQQLQRDRSRAMVEMRAVDRDRTLAQLWWVVMERRTLQTGRRRQHSSCTAR